MDLQLLSYGDKRTGEQNESPTSQDRQTILAKRRRGRSDWLVRLALASLTGLKYGLIFFFVFGESSFRRWCHQSEGPKDIT